MTLALGHLFSKGQIKIRKGEAERNQERLNIAFDNLLGLTQQLWYPGPSRRGSILMNHLSFEFISSIFTIEGKYLYEESVPTIETGMNPRYLEKAKMKHL